ncbi:MAG: membrane-bound lytic murein transglycosylase A [Planctomycetota bacterium]|jgi:membrane-bound lytic murein transglycosylase A
MANITELEHRASAPGRGLRRLHSAALLVAGALLAVGCQSTPNYGTALPPGAPALIPLAPGEAMPDFAGDWHNQDEILPALDLSIDWLQRKHAPGFFPAADIDHDRVLASTIRFRELLAESESPQEFEMQLLREFQVYKSAGWNGRGGGVLFTAYCTPILKGNKEESATYRFPLYALPDDLVKNKDGSVLGWETDFGMMSSYPSRQTIEANAILADRDLELVWLADPIDAYLAHVNGSAFIELPDGSMMRLGYAGKNGLTYQSLGRALVDEGRIPRGEASLRTIRSWAAEAGEEELLEYLHRNPSYVFFTPIDGNPHGSLDVPVTGGRSLATDKSLFPRGSLVFVEARTPRDAPRGTPQATFERFMFDQDTGGAIRTAGRADIYLGIGPEAEELAGQVKSTGQLYYLFLKD